MDGGTDASRASGNDEGHESNMADVNVNGGDAGGFTIIINRADGYFKGIFARYDRISESPGTTTRGMISTRIATWWRVIRLDVGAAWKQTRASARRNDGDEGT